MVDLGIVTTPFFQRALLIGLMLGALMAILGVFIVLRRLSFFSDAIGHAALTGIALGLLLNVNPFLSALCYTLLVAAAIATLQHRSRLPLDTILGVFFSASVAIGVVLVQLTPGYQASLFSFLFGDILTVGTMDIVLTLIVTAVTLTILTLFGKKFISIAFNPSLAKAEGIPVALHETLFLLTLAAVIALAIKLVGVILVTALLVIPAASAHNLARSLASMFLLSVGLNVVAVIVGMLASVFLNTASGPTIILVSTAFFILSLLLRPLLARVPA
ncbi:MAG TPA: metal ABC transporter permease [Candidatus Andersenbacteria bacterium]|nr:metal ABC transporter permease [Candidatus Andersenbacteria bacterium]